jgi:hypothetical protein
MKAKLTKIGAVKVAKNAKLTICSPPDFDVKSGLLLPNKEIC